jgi:hypothetical protein
VHVDAGFNIVFGGLADPTP